MMISIQQIKTWVCIGIQPLILSLKNYLAQLIAWDSLGLQDNREQITNPLAYCERIARQLYNFIHTKTSTRVMRLGMKRTNQRSRQKAHGKSEPFDLHLKHFVAENWHCTLPPTRPLTGWERGPAVICGWHWNWGANWRVEGMLCSWPSQ